MAEARLWDYSRYSDAASLCLFLGDTFARDVANSSMDDEYLRGLAFCFTRSAGGVVYLSCAHWFQPLPELRPRSPPPALIVCCGIGAADPGDRSAPSS